MFSEGKISFDLWNTIGEILEKSGKKRPFLKCMPKVIKNGVLISAIFAMFLAGCAFPTSSSAVGKDAEQERIEQRIDEAREADFEAEYMPEFQKYITRSYVSTEEQAKIIICTTNEQMKPYFPDKIQNPTYEDVRNTIRKNERIPEKFKIKYIEFLNKMEKELPDIDLFVLNSNVERMKVSEWNDLGNANGIFNYETGKIEYRRDASDFTIAHEFGHAVLSAELKTEDGTIVLKTFKFPENKVGYNWDEGIDYFYTLFHGAMVEEYAADKFAEMLSGEENEESRPYAPTDYHMEMFMAACDYAFEDFIREGATGFGIAMLQNDINYPISIMDDLDHLISRYNIEDYDAEFPKYGVTINSIPVDFFEDWAKEKFDREEDKIPERAIEIIKGTAFVDGVCYMYGGDDPRIVDSTTPEELTEKVEYALRELDRRKTTSLSDFWEDLQER